jgi:hypothetical protein
MTDEELTELAAKAFGLNEYESQFWGFDPLNEDADAFRLAVKLRLPIRDGFNGTVITGNEKSGWPIWEMYGDDPYAATRRAIVRAAAEIKRGME